MSLLDLDPAAWWHAGVTVALNLLAFASGIAAVALVALLAGGVVSSTRDGLRRRRTSRRAWREAAR